MTLALPHTIASYSYFVWLRTSLDIMYPCFILHSCQYNIKHIAMYIAPIQFIQEGVAIWIVLNNCVHSLVKPYIVYLVNSLLTDAHVHVHISI